MHPISPSGNPKDIALPKRKIGEGSSRIFSIHPKYAVTIGKKHPEKK